MKKDFKWGIIGPGRIAYKFADAVHEIKGASIYAIASRSVKDSEKLRQSFAAEMCYDSYEALVNDPNVDAVYVATPHRFHYENVLLCMQAGKHTLCEKSFTVNANQADELFSLSQKHRLFLMEAMWTRFLPIYSQVRKWMDREEIGEVRFVRSSLGFVAARDYADRLLNIELAGGTVLDLAVYTSALTQWTIGKNPSVVHASGFIGETGVDESINVSYRYEDGAAAQFNCTFEYQPENEFVIFGRKGRITVQRNFYNSTEAALHKGNQTKTVHRPFKTNGFEYQIMAAMEAIEAGRLDCEQMPQVDSLNNMRALDIIRQQIGMHYPFE